jgi:RHS repeat-associated protein
MASATGGDNFSLTWDKNGRLVLSSHEPQATSYVWNWDGKLRSATCSPNSISLKYDPFGNRVIKNSSINGNRKYIVDISGELPTILMEINPSNGDIMKTYVYANSQILMQHDGDHTADKYFYLHDRLGSVRLVVDESGTIQNSYTYNPFGKSFDSEFAENVTNPFKFTGQFYDTEILQYYLRARMYDPALMRFTARDPVRGERQEPLTLHKYLYCFNDSMNNIDPSGEFLDTLLSSAIGFLNDSLDAISSMAAGIWAQIQVNKWAIFTNAMFSGVYNMFMGPDSVSDTKKFLTGAIAGASEIIIAIKGHPTAGGAFAGAFTSSINEALSKNPELSFKTVLKVGMSAGFGALEGYTASFKKDIDKQIKFFLTYRARDIYTGLGERIDELW